MQAIIELKAREPVLPKFPPYGISILESRHTEEFTMRPSQYDFSEIMLVLEGNGWIVHGGIRHPLNCGNFVAVPKGDSYFIEDHATNPLAILCLCIRPTGSQEGLWKDVLPQVFAVQRKSPLTREVAGHLRSILFEQSQARTCTEAVVIGQSLLLLSKLRRKAGGLDQVDAKSQREVEVASRVRDYAEALTGNFHEAETIEAVSARLEISAKSLTMHFRAITGKSRHEYIKDLRLDHARRLLSETAQSVTSISFACGFEDLSTFFRAFRQRHQISPSQWRGKQADADISILRFPKRQDFPAWS
ncbi:AraC family transcriptional regulator [soil metagenome]